MVFVFSREAIKDLISLYEQNPELYNSALPDYKKKVLRQKTWDKILVQFQALFPEATKDDLQKKMTNLRTQFFTELNKYKKSLVSGSGTSDIYKPSWRCYDLLMFLNANNPVEEGDSNLLLAGQAAKLSQDDESDVIFDGTVEELNVSTVVTPTPSVTPKAGRSRTESPISTVPSVTETIKNNQLTKRKRQASTSVTDNLIQQAAEALKTNSKEADHFETFALNLASEMRQIRNVALVTRLKRKFLNEVYDILDEQNGN